MQQLAAFNAGYAWNDGQPYILCIPKPPVSAYITSTYRHLVFDIPAVIPYTRRMKCELPLAVTLSKTDMEYLLELLNNERYASNTNLSLAESLTAKLVAAADVAHADAIAEDAWWTEEDASAELSEEEVEARLWEMRHQW